MKATKRDLIISDQYPRQLLFFPHRHFSRQYVQVELVRRADGHVRLVHLPSHLLPLLRAVAVPVLTHLKDEVEILLGVLALQEGAEQSCTVCEI